jgi:hypothetical protein
MSNLENNLENNVKDVITKQLSNGLVEKLVAENLEKGINNALNDLFDNYGSVTRIIKDKIKSVLVEKLEAYDYSKYVVKMDYVLTEILKNTTLDNRKILDNFKGLMTNEDIPEIMKVTDIFEKYCDYVSKEIDTSNLEICEDYEPSYCDANASFEIQDIEARPYSYYLHASMFLECKEDEELNIEIRLSKSKDDKYWRISYDKECDIKSLRYLNKFQVYLLKLSQSRCKIEVNEWEDREDVEIDQEPTADVTYS